MTKKKKSSVHVNWAPGYNYIHTEYWRTVTTSYSEKINIQRSQGSPLPLPDWNHKGWVWQSRSYCLQNLAPEAEIFLTYSEVVWGCLGFCRLYLYIYIYAAVFNIYNRKQKFVFLGRQTINSNKHLLFQQTNDKKVFIKN